MKTIAMIPARLGSQRLKQKNLRELGGVPLITRAIRKCKQAGCFDEIWVNSENEIFGEIAAAEGVKFHHRPEVLGDNNTTHEQYIAEFIKANNVEADAKIMQVHSIAPLLTAAETKAFAQFVKETDADSVFSFEPVQIECAYKGQPVNFVTNAKTNSQELAPIQRFSWSIASWTAGPFIAAYEADSTDTCATYSGKIDYYPVGKMAGHIIKDETDLAIAEALLPLIEAQENATA